MVNWLGRHTSTMNCTSASRVLRISRGNSYAPHTFSRSLSRGGNTGPLVAQRVEEIVEVTGEAACFIFRVYTGLLSGPHRNRYAEDLVRFLIGKGADEISEEWQAVHLGKEDIDRDLDAQRLRDICEPGLQIASGCRHRIGALREETLQADAEQHGAGRLRSAFERLQLTGLQALHQAYPVAGIAQNGAAGFNQRSPAREPEIGRRAWERSYCPDKAGPPEALLRCRSSLPCWSWR